MKKTKLKTLTISLLFIFSIPIWLNVDLLPIRIWDESRNAVNAIEMYQSGDFLVRTFNKSPETYELKPPLLIWLQVGCLHWFGLNELAIRFPSVFFSVMSLLLVFIITYSSTKSYWSSAFAMGITATSFGFFGDHVGRFGDHDATLVFFILLLAYSTHQFMKTEKASYLYWIGVSLMFGVLCKSIAIFMLAPGLLVALLINKKVVLFLSNKHFYTSIFTVTFIVSSYYYLRELRQPGYLNLVWQGELFPRYINQSSSFVFEEYTFWYYFELLFNNQMRYWAWMVSVVVAVPFWGNWQFKGWVFWLIQSLSFLLIISLGTKNFWYVAPAIPMLAILFAISLYLLANRLKVNYKWASLLVFLLLAVPYNNAFLYAINTSEKHYEWETNGISHYLKDEQNIKNLSPNTKILLDRAHGLEPHLFYLKKLNIEHGLSISRINWQELNPGDTLLISHLSTYSELKDKYAISVLDSSYKHTKLLTIKLPAKQVAQTNRTIY
jgi:4-amino-4-deoxy-L-arabinose transferase-like glycosyltransferase